MKAKYIAYYRVSTREQEMSGLGLEDQKYQVRRMIGKKNIVKEFVEVESGKKRKRPQLESAIQICKETGYTLVVSKLDRLGRKAGYLHEIKDNIKLFICESPNMTPLEFAIRAGMAEEEGVKISQRTKAALAAKKRQGFQLGKPENLTHKAQIKGAKARALKAQERLENKQAFAVIRGLRNQGKSYKFIAQELNSCGAKTVNCKDFQATTAMRIYKMFANN